MSKKNENKKSVITAPNGVRLVVDNLDDRRAVEDMVTQAEKALSEENTRKKIPLSATGKRAKEEARRKSNLPGKGSFFKEWEDSEKGAVYTKISKDGGFSDLEIIDYDPQKGRVEIREYTDKKEEGKGSANPGKPEHYYLKYDEFIKLINSGYKKDIDREPKEIQLMGETLIINKEYIFFKGEDKRDKFSFRIGTYKPGELSKNSKNRGGSIREAGTFSVFINNKERGFGTIEDLKKWFSKIRKEGYEVIDREKFKGESIIKENQETPTNTKKPKELDTEAITEKVSGSENRGNSQEEYRLGISQTAETDRDTNKRNIEQTRRNKPTDEKQKEDEPAVNKQTSEEMKPRYSQGEAMEYFIKEQDKKETSGQGSDLLDNDLDLDQEADEAILSQREQQDFYQKDSGGIDGRTGESSINSPENINQAGKFEFEPGGNISEKEADKFVVDELYKKMERSFVRFSKARQASNRLDRLLAKFPGMKDGKKGQARREYEIAKDQFEADRTRFRNAYDKYAATVVKENKEEINKMPLAQGGLEFAKAVAVFLVSGKVVEITKKEIDESGNKKELKEKVSLIEDYNNRLRNLNEARMENADGKTKKALKATWNFYKKIPRWQKIALGAVLSGGLAMTTGGALAGLTYGGYRALKGAGSASLTSGLGLLFTKNLDKFKLKEKNKLKDKITEKYEKGVQDIFVEIDEYNKKLKNKQRNDALKIMGAALAAGSASNVFNDEILEILTNSFPANHIFEITDKVNDSGINEEYLKDSDYNSRESVTPIAGELKAESSPQQTEALVGKTITEKETAQEVVIETETGGKVFQLGKGGTVWDALERSDYFEGNQTKIANALVVFKNEAREKLMEEYGMETEQANRFIEWRFRHMRPADTVLVSKDGQVEIAGFDDSKVVSRYNSLSRNVESLDTEKVISSEVISKNNDSFVFDNEQDRESSFQALPSELTENSTGETDIGMAEDVLSSKEGVVKANLKAIGMKIDSPEWQTVRNIKVKDFITTVSPKESWFSGNIEEMVEKLKKFSGADYKLGGFMSNMSFQEFNKLKQLSALLEKNALSPADKNLSVGEFLANNIKNIKK
jgi:uncharacterized protein YukE